ncbi:P53 DNA-Hypothetical protein domain [Nesidiocoris tenuis]|uniref:p53 DNA-binding domain-containing protein n=1 Tax=Nesidiocoris tenuis TaxID=355587 RepID=A0ABN7A716_9HEMI|nr:P53 DNA-Hypothetical protein domain [Nesidiocoris tenuis]
MDDPAAKRIKLEMQLDELNSWPNVGDESSNNEKTPNSIANADDLHLDFPGPCDFGFYFRKDSMVINSCLYSKMLNQVFVRMSNIIHLHFRVNQENAPVKEMFIRATLIYCGADNMAVPVRRCPLHSLEDDPLSLAHADGACRCAEYKLVGHVIRSTSTSAVYCYDQETGRHSVVVPIRHGLHDLLYSYACKSSCSRGMERRLARTVFTLEDENGNVFGRSSVNVKICSCPKRDMERQEKEFIRYKGDLVLRPWRNRPENRNSIEATPNGKIDVNGTDVSIKNSADNSNPNIQIKNLVTMINQAKRQIAALQDFCSNMEKVLDSIESDI